MTDDAGSDEEAVRRPRALFESLEAGSWDPNESRPADIAAAGEHAVAGEHAAAADHAAAGSGVAGAVDHAGADAATAERRATNWSVPNLVRHAAPGAPGAPPPVAEAAVVRRRLGLSVSSKVAIGLALLFVATVTLLSSTSGNDTGTGGAGNANVVATTTTVPATTSSAAPMSTLLEGTYIFDSDGQPIAVPDGAIRVTVEDPTDDGNSADSPAVVFTVEDPADSIVATGPSVVALCRSLFVRLEDLNALVGAEPALTNRDAMAALRLEDARGVATRYLDLLGNVDRSQLRIYQAAVVSDDIDVVRAAYRLVDEYAAINDVIGELRALANVAADQDQAADQVDEIRLILGRKAATNDNDQNLISLWISDQGIADCGNDLTAPTP